LTSIDAVEAMDNSPEQKDLEAALAQLDAEIAAERNKKKDADSD
jgi:transcription initiation factor IIE alpha subunit